MTKDQLTFYRRLNTSLKRVVKTLISQGEDAEARHKGSRHHHGHHHDRHVKTEIARLLGPQDLKLYESLPPHVRQLVKGVLFRHREDAMPLAPENPDTFHQGGGRKLVAI
jgi:hypothetical protein